MCNPTSSSLLAKQLKIVNEHNGPELIELSRETKNKILDFISKSVNLNTIYMLGGEPLINEFHDEIVDLLVCSNRAKKPLFLKDSIPRLNIPEELNSVFCIISELTSKLLCFFAQHAKSYTYFEEIFESTIKAILSF